MSLSPEQVAERLTGLGGSDGAAIIGVSPFKTALDVFMEKTGQKEPEEETQAMKMGSLLEPIVARLFVDDLAKDGHVVELKPAPKEAFRFSDMPHILGHVDFLVHHPKWGLGVLECKTTNAFRKEDWKDQTPLHYQVQVQHYLGLVPGALWGASACLIGGVDFVWQRLEPDHGFQEAYYRKLDHFWKHHIEKRQLPVVNFSKDHDTIRRLTQTLKPGQVAYLDGELVTKAERFEEVKKELAKLEKEKKELDGMLRMAIGEAEFARLPDGSGYSYKAKHRDSYTVEAADLRELRRMKKVEVA